MSAKRHDEAGDEAERDQHGGDAERAAVHAFEPFEAGEAEPIDGRAGVFQRIALHEVHQAGDEADAARRPCRACRKTPWSMPSR